MAKCKKCGAELRDYYEFCLNCWEYNALSDRIIANNPKDSEMNIHGTNTDYGKSRVISETKRPISRTNKNLKVDNYNNKGLIAIIFFTVFLIIIIIDYRWIIGILILGFLVMLGWGVGESQKHGKTPSEKQKRHKTKNWAKRNMRQNMKRKL